MSIQAFACKPVGMFSAGVLSGLAKDGQEAYLRMDPGQEMNCVNRSPQWGSSSWIISCLLKI